jgi:hypothetical protein
MRTPVIMYVEPDDTAERQHRHIIEYCEDRDLNVTSICESPAAAAEAVRGGIAQVVVAARDPRNGLRHAVTIAGGRVELVRDHNRLPSLRDFLARALRRGRTPHDIASGVGDETTDIAELLKRLNLGKPNRRDE